MAIEFIHERGRTEDYQEWARKLNDTVATADIAFVYPVGFDVVKCTSVNELTKIFSNHRIVVYEQELRRGGGFEGVVQVLSLLQPADVVEILIYLQGVRIASIFFEELVKDVTNQLWVD